MTPGGWLVWLGTALLAATMCLGDVAQAAPLSLEAAEGRHVLRSGERALVSIAMPWITTGDWKAVRRFPANAPARSETIPGGTRTVRVDEGAHGRWTQTVTSTADALTVRYDFDFAAIPEAANIQWVWTLDPAVYDAALIEGEAQTPIPLRSAAGASVKGLRRLDFVLPDYDLSVRFTAADGAWQFQDARAAPWQKSYRVDYEREFNAGGKRSGWFEVTLRGAAAAAAYFPLTGGASRTVRGVPLAVGAPLASVGRTVPYAVFWHTADGTAAAGATVGEVEVVYSDGKTETVPLRWETAVTSPTDDPRDLAEGVLAPQPGSGPAWLTLWRNPRPDVPVARIAARTLGAGWRLLAAAGVDAGADARRVAAATLSLSPGAVAEATTVSLNGVWRFQPEGGTERDIPVPAVWERQPELRGVRRSTYRRTLDIPASFQGRRIALRFDAVGDAAEVWVNGELVGGRISPALPFEVDISGYVTAPSTGNRLEVVVRDDSHFGMPRPGEPGRGRRHWIPRGMGTGNRKGLYQNVALVARPTVQVRDVRVQTSVRKREMTVVYELFNSRHQTVTAKIGGDVRPAGGGGAVMTLPEKAVELPGLVATTVTVTAPMGDVTLWQPDHPALYSLRTVLSDADGTRLQRADTRFGFREVWFDGIHFTLNGIRCNLRGESPSYGEKLDMFATREAAAEMVRRYQKANFNVLRFHSLPAPPHVMDVCDELGMLVIDESGIYASWQMLMPEHPDWMANIRDHLTRWVRRDRNHPSVILWSAENEGLNVNGLTPAMLPELRKIIDAEDGTRPVIFDGDGTGYGASPASVKHYVRTLDDLRDRGGRASGYARDLRSDIYWATEFKQEIPLGIGEFLFPYEPGLRAREREAIYMMGLQTRGYRLANWFDIRPYNPSYSGFLRAEGLREGYEEAYDVIVKSFAPVAVFDRDYDALGPFPKPPVLRRGQSARRTLIVYNDTFADDKVEVAWEAKQGGRRIAGERRTLTIPLGGHTTVEIAFTPDAPGDVTLDLTSSKAGKETFRDQRKFVAE